MSKKNVTFVTELLMNTCPFSTEGWGSTPDAFWYTVDLQCNTYMVLARPNSKGHFDILEWSVIPSEDGGSSGFCRQHTKEESDEL